MHFQKGSIYIWFHAKTHNYCLFPFLDGDELMWIPKWLFKFFRVISAAPEE